eukprot:gene878-1354_t
MPTWRKSASVVIACPLSATPPPEACAGLQIDQQTDYRVCMMKRTAKARFMANFVVFPGGAFDSVDRIVAEKYFAQLSADDQRTVSRICATREAFEEAGAPLFTPPVPADSKHWLHTWRSKVHDNDMAFADLLEQYALQPSIANLHFWCSFTTPDFQASRGKKGGFHTDFFVTTVPADAVHHFSCDAKETTTLDWFSPEELLAAAAAQRVTVAPPQWLILDEMRRVAPRMADLAAAAGGASRALLREHDIKPHLISAGKSLVTALPGDEQHPTYPLRGQTHRMTFTKSLGNMHRVCTVPSDATIPAKAPDSSKL